MSCRFAHTNNDKKMYVRGKIYFSHYSRTFLYIRNCIFHTGYWKFKWNFTIIIEFKEDNDIK